MDVSVVKEGTSVNEIYGGPKTFWDRIFQPKYICCILTAVNLLNYCDRGIVPGSTNEFDSFITRTLGTTTPDVYLGLLQSAFIVGFSLASIACGHAVHYYPPFYLCGVGLSVWCVAVLLSGLSFYMDSYYFLMASRMLSGCGEASFQCSVPPWIQSTMEDGSKGMWLSLFYTAIPVGTAIGYVYSSIISDTIGVKWAFIFECFMMLPFVFYLFAVSPRFPKLGAPAKPQGLADTDSLQKLLEPSRSKVPGGLGDYDRDDIDSVNNGKETRGSDQSDIIVGKDEVKMKSHHPSLWDELKSIFVRPVYLCVVMGYAAQTGSLIGVSTFGSAFLMGIGFYDSETSASSIFGLLISVAGIVGTLAGGYFLDKGMDKAKALAKRERDHVSSEMSLADLALVHRREEKKIRINQIVVSCSMIAVANIIGACCLWSVYFIYDKTLYMLMTGLGCAFIFFTTPAISIAAMNSVKFGNRAFAMAMMSVMLHLFGDVPSPVLAGMLKDDLAPDCIGVDASSAQCRADGPGLRKTMLIITLWLAWCAVFFGAGRFIAQTPELRCDQDDDDDPEESQLDQPLMMAH